MGSGKFGSLFVALLAALLLLSAQVRGTSASGSPQELKQNAILKLEQISTSDRNLQKTIQNAIEDISESLTDKDGPLFLDEFRIVPPSGGKRVFDRERKAVQELLKGIKNTPQDVEVIFLQVIDDLVEADRLISVSSIGVAKRLVDIGLGNAKKLDKAEKELDKALTEDKASKAIQRFEKAWEFSQKVFGDKHLLISSFGDSPDPFSARLTANELSVTFQTLKKPKKDAVFELTQIISDSSGNVVRTLNTQQEIVLQVSKPLGDEGDDDDDSDDDDDYDDYDDDDDAPRTFEIKGTSIWDGRDDAGQIVPDGTYTYLAFGSLISSKGGDDDDDDDDDDDEDGKTSSFPVLGTIVVDSTPPTLTASVDPQPNGNDWHNSAVTVSFQAADDLSGIAQVTPQIVVTSEGANQVVTGTATDLAGNTANVSVTLNIDKTDPTITAVGDPLPNQNGWNNTDVAVSFAATDGLSGIEFVTPDTVLTTEGTGQIVTGVATDLAGNGASATLSVNLDKTAPFVQILSPADGATVTSPEIVVSGAITEVLSGIEAVTCNGIPAASSDFSCTVSLVDGSNTIVVEATDLAGNTGSAAIEVTLSSSGEPEIEILEPTTGFVTAETRIRVSGEVSGPVDAVTVNGVPAVIADEIFVVESLPLVEGTNRIVATAQTAGGQSASDSISVRRDTDPPLVVVETPREGDRLVSETVTVAGTVNDIIPGATVNEDDVTVTVNGNPAAVNNRTFILPDLSLLLGQNIILASAIDRAGNSSVVSVQVTREPDLAGIRLMITEGNNQQGPISTLLPLPLEIQVQNPNGEPLTGRPIDFEVSRGDGLLGDPAENTRRMTLLTDATGRASVDFTLGSRTGEGFHRVRVTTPGSLSFAEFCATANPADARTISISMPPPTQSVVNQPISDPLSVIVTDEGGNSVPGVPVTFQVNLGGGNFGGEESRVAITNPDGIALAEWSLGSQAGTANNEASATFEGNPGFPATFTVSGIALGPIEETTISGIVQDSTANPIEGVRAVIRGTNLEAFTGADGRFSITDVPPGGHRVGVLGSTANDPGSAIFFPDIEFAIEVVSGAENKLDQIVVLPFLNMPGAKLVGGNEDVVLEMEGVPGFAIKVFANSVILPDGTRGEVLMSSTQVKFDKIPMPPPQGSTPLIVGTLQPAGIRFDPPAQVTYPNVEGLAPGDVADIFAFHHDIGQFVNIGPGTVSEDGSIVISDPGFGIVQSGWHCLIRIPGLTADCANDCSAQVQWRISNPVDGSLGPVRTDGFPMVPAETVVRVVARFSPGGGEFGAQWSMGSSGLRILAETVSENLATVFVQVADGSRPGKLTSPVYRIAQPGQEDKTCQIEVIVNPVAFVDSIPDYAKDPENAEDDDSDNFFLRQNQDHENLDIIYLIPADLSVDDVKINIYEGSEDNTPIAVLAGEKDGSGRFKVGENLRAKWTPDLAVSPEGMQADLAGFYRVELEVKLEGARLKTPIHDADADPTNGWQCPQNGLAIHDLAWKHRPNMFTHPEEFAGPSDVNLMLKYAELVERVQTPRGGENRVVLPAPLQLQDLPMCDTNSCFLRFTSSEPNPEDRQIDIDISRTRTPREGERVMYFHGVHNESNFAYLQYWHFEPSSFGVSNLLDDILSFHHEGDWEMVQVAVLLGATPRRQGGSEVVVLGAVGSPFFWAVNRTA